MTTERAHTVHVLTAVASFGQSVGSPCPDDDQEVVMETPQTQPVPDAPDAPDAPTPAPPVSPSPDPDEPSPQPDEDRDDDDATP